MTAEKAEWEPQWVRGGFAGHCLNQGDQRWTFHEEGEPYRMRLSQAFFTDRRMTICDEPYHFHDYNF